MTDTQLLEAMIERSGLKKCAISERVGIRPQALRAKVAGRYEFKQSEIAALTDILRLTDDEREQIFFAK